MAGSGNAPFYKKKWFIVVVVLLVLGAIGSVGGNDDKANAPADSQSTAASSVAAPESAAAESGSASESADASVAEMKTEPQVEVADKKLLQNAYENSGGMDEGSFTKDSWSKFKKARKAAKKVLDDKKATQDEVDAAHTKLTDAISALEEKLNPDNYEAVDYTSVARTPDEWQGRLVQFSGRVLQVSEGSGENLIRLATNGDYDDVVAVGYDPAIMGSTRILEDDYISAYGTCIGIYSYTATMGQTISIPGVYADHIVIN